METIRVAEIRKTFGLKGEVLCYSLTSFPALRFKKGRTFYLTKEGSEERGKGEEHTPATNGRPGTRREGFAILTSDT